MSHQLRLGANALCVLCAVDPATLDVVGSVADMNVADTRAAIDAAAVALKGWRGLVARVRHCMRA